MSQRRKAAGPTARAPPDTPPHSSKPTGAASTKEHPANSRTAQKALRVAVVSAVFFVCFYVNLLASVVAGWRTPNQPPLPDVGHELLGPWRPHLEAATSAYFVRHLPDWCVAANLLAALLWWLHDDRKLLLFVRTFSVLAGVLLFRSYCVTVTQLPDMSPHCRQQFEKHSCWFVFECPDPTGSYKTEPIFPTAFRRAFKVLCNPLLDTCGDLMFSGHTVGLWLPCMVFQEYCPHAALRALLVLSSVVGSLAIVLTLFHYTLDVSVGCFVSYTCWTIFHRHAKGPQLRAHSGWIGALLEWLEAPIDPHEETKVYYS